MKVQSPSERLNAASPRRLLHAGFVTTIIGRSKVTLLNRILFAFLFAAIWFAPTLAAASGVHPLFNLQSTTQSPFPSDRFTQRDSRQKTKLRVNLPLPDCTTRPSDCLDVRLLNQLDGFNT